MPRFLAAALLSLFTFMAANVAVAENVATDPWAEQLAALDRIDPADGHYVVGLVVFAFMNTDQGESPDPMAASLRQSVGFRALAEAARRVAWPEMADALLRMVEQIERTGWVDEEGFQGVMGVMGQLEDSRLEAQLSTHGDQVERLSDALQTHIDQTVAAL